MADHPTYEIESLADLLAVPVEKRADLIADLITWMFWMDAVMAVPGGEELISKRMIWVDDGERVMRGVYLNGELVPIGGAK